MVIRLRPRCRAVSVVMFAVSAVSCGGSGEPVPGDAPAAAAASTTVTAPSTTVACRPAPLEARAATVLAIGINNATTADSPVAAQVAAMGVGGVILLGQNITDAAQAKSLIAGMRERSPRGLLFAVDEEGGRVSRLRPIVGSTPSARTLGQRPLADIAAVGAERGTVLRELGFNLALAPVVDADGGPAGGAVGDRAFASTPADAGRRAAAFAEGLQRAGVGATAKHFPGLGGLPDSHDGPVVSDAPLPELRATASAGFRPVIDAGVGAVMMSHVTYQALGSLPASLEPSAYALLRSIGFGGVAITDAVGMESIVGQFTLAEAAVVALKAGADLVLATGGTTAGAMRDGVAAAVAEGRLSESRLDEAVRRVLTLRGENPATMVCR